MTTKACGPGWDSLIDPLIKRCHELGGEIEQIKEKYGRLCFYYTEKGPASEALWVAFEDMVQEAERDSAHTCELCGARSVMMIRGGWYKTLCQKHANEIGYKEKA